MSQFLVGTDWKSALESTYAPCASRYDAVRSAAPFGVTELAAEFISDDKSALLVSVQQGEERGAVGFYQWYEDLDGRTVLAVLYWKISLTTDRQSGTERHCSDLFDYAD